MMVESSGRRYRKCGSGTETGTPKSADASVVTIIRSIHPEQWYWWIPSFGNDSSDSRIDQGIHQS
jgi:hypothetical protein